MTEEELAEVTARYEAASEGPWYAHATDDVLFQNAVYVSTQKGNYNLPELYHDQKRGLAEGDFCQAPPGTVIAITALQEPYLALMDDNKDDQNTLFIAHARADMPRLIDEIRRLQSLLTEAHKAAENTETLSEEELVQIIARCEAASDGPWYAHTTDDERSQNASYVSIQEVANGTKGFVHDNHQGMAEGNPCQIPVGVVVAITVLQKPDLASVDDNKAAENTLFIAHSRTDMPRLVAEIRRLQQIGSKTKE